MERLTRVVEHAHGAAESDRVDAFLGSDVDRVAQLEPQILALTYS
jgi:hypothetical protein